MKIWACFFCKKAEEKVTFSTKNFLNVEEIEEKEVQPFEDDERFDFSYRCDEEEIEGEARFNDGKLGSRHK